MSNNETKGDGEYIPVSEVGISNRLKVFNVKDSGGKLYRATWLNRDYLIEKYKHAVHRENEDLTLEEIEKKAEERFKKSQARFRAYYEIAKGLSSSTVAETYKFIYDKELGGNIIISEYVSGHSIFDATFGLTPLQMIAIFVKAFDSVDLQHGQGLLNLNIKSSSFWVNLEGSEPVVKLMNLGFAIPRSEYNGEFHGTPFYMAPEVALGQKGKIDERADLFSMGILLYRCLTRHYPFETRHGSTHSLANLIKRIEKEGTPPAPRNYRDSIPEKLEELVLDLLKKDPDARTYDTANKVISFFQGEWPEASREMIAERTITSSDFSDNDEKSDDLDE